MVYSQTTVDLTKGDILAFYMDGITEARGRDGSFFEIDGLEQTLKGHEFSGGPEGVRTLLAMQIVP